MAKILTVLIALLLAGCATQIGQRNTSDQRLTMFSQIVFAPDYDSRREEYVTKWTSPLRIALRDRDTYFVEQYRELMKTQVEATAGLTGLPVKIVADSPAANVTVFFDSLSGLIQYAQGYARDKSASANIQATGCHSEIDKNARHEITAARIFVRAEREVTGMLSTDNNIAKEANAENTRRTDQCIAFEMIRILGLRNASDILTPSIFNSTRTVDKSTVLDLKFVRTLYAPQMKAGMPRKEALLIADAELQK